MKTIISKSSPLYDYYQKYYKTSQNNIEYEDFYEEEEETECTINQDEQEQIDLKNKQYFDIYKDILNNNYYSNGSSSNSNKWFVIICIFVVDVLYFMLEMKCLVLVVSVFVMYSFYFRWEEKRKMRIHEINLMFLERFLKGYKKWFALVKRGIAILIEMELVFKGFNLSYPYPPLHRIELHNFKYGIKNNNPLRLNIHKSLVNVLYDINWEDCKSNIKNRNNYSLKYLKYLLKLIMERKEGFYNELIKRCDNPDNDSNLFSNFGPVYFKSKIFILERESDFLQELYRDYISISNKSVFVKDKIFVYEMNRLMNELSAKLNIFNLDIINDEKIDKRKFDDITNYFDLLKNRFIVLSKSIFQFDDDIISTEELNKEEEEEETSNSISIVHGEVNEDNNDIHREIIRINDDDDDNQEEEEIGGDKTIFQNSSILNVYKSEVKEKKKVLPIFTGMDLSQIRLPFDELKSLKKNKMMKTIDHTIPAQSEEDSIMIEKKEIIGGNKFTFIGELNKVLEHRRDNILKEVVKKVI